MKHRESEHSTAARGGKLREGRELNRAVGCNTLMLHTEYVRNLRRSSEVSRKARRLSNAVICKPQRLTNGPSSSCVDDYRYGSSYALVCIRMQRRSNVQSTWTRRHG